jgi:hypothetical protein
MAYTQNLARRQGKPATPLFTTRNFLVAKMLASTMQISNNNPTNTQAPHEVTEGQREDQNNQPTG